MDKTSMKMFLKVMWEKMEENVKISLFFIAGLSWLPLILNLCIKKFQILPQDDRVFFSFLSSIVGMLFLMLVIVTGDKIKTSFEEIKSEADRRVQREAQQRASRNLQAEAHNLAIDRPVIASAMARLTAMSEEIRMRENSSPPVQFSGVSIHSPLVSEKVEEPVLVQSSPTESSPSNVSRLDTIE